MEDTVTLNIGKNEALLLFELLAEFRNEPALNVRDNADRLALTRLCCVLEKALLEPFMENYDEIIRNARAQLNDDWSAQE